MTTCSAKQTLSLEVIDTINSIINRGQAFTAVDISNNLKMRGVTNDAGSPVRHRDVNDYVRSYMTYNFLPINSNWQLTTIYPDYDVNKNNINAPDGIFLYHPVGYNTSKYEVPTMIPTSTSPVTYTPIVQTPIKAINPVKVTSVFTDDTKDGVDTWIFRATCDKDTPKENIFKAVCEKMMAKIDVIDGYLHGVLSKEYPWHQIGEDDIDNTLDENIVILVSIYGNDEKYSCFKDFAKIYDPIKEEEVEDENLGKQVFSFSNTPTPNSLPEDHLAVEADGRLRIPSVIIYQLIVSSPQNLVLTRGDLKNTIKYLFK